jgi:hypothetical protein
MNEQQQTLVLLALEALESCGSDGCQFATQWHDEELVGKALTAIKQALAAPVQEPVGEVQKYWQHQFDDDGRVIGSYPKKTVTSGVYKLPHGTKLYTTPPAQPAVPLMNASDEERAEFAQWKKDKLAAEPEKGQP